jgi:2-iminobutanoate/2-iminopropanoate deaminase
VPWRSRSGEQIQEPRTVLFRVYGTQLPASSLVRVAGLFSPELQIEVEAILALDTAGEQDR